MLFTARASAELDRCYRSGVNLRIYHQAYCDTCKVAIGFAGQGPAYFTKGGAECGRHIDKEWKKMVDDAAKDSR